MENITQYLVEEASHWGPKIAGALLILVVFYILTKVTKQLIISSAQRLKLDKHLTTLLIRTSRITLMIFGFISAFGTLGINISALVAGLGLTGFALGFALKDTISNLLSGIKIQTAVGRSLDQQVNHLCVLQSFYNTPSDPNLANLSISLLTGE